MEIAGGIAIVSTVAALVNNIAITIMTIKQLHDQIKSADAALMSIIAQLSTIKAALYQIQELLDTAEYHQQLQLDLETAMQATQLHLDFIASKISKFKTKNAASTLRFSSKVKMIFESDDMAACLQRLNHQATALNLLISVLTSRSVTEQRAMLQRSYTRKLFKQIQEDNTSLLDDSSKHTARNQRLVRPAWARTTSEPVINTNPVKSFDFDKQVLQSKAYGGKQSWRRASDKDMISEGVSQIDSDSIQDENMTLVADTDISLADAVKSKLDFGVDNNKAGTPPRFSKMLAIGQAQSEIMKIVTNAQQLWSSAQDANAAPSVVSKQAGQMHRLTTHYFDVSISAYTFDDYHRICANRLLLDTFRDVSNILFVVNLASYHYDSRRLDQDLHLFAKTTIDYSLWLAKIILFLETTGLDSYSAYSMPEDIKQRFMQAGRVGINTDRVRVVVGESDETAAGTIFKMCNESERTQENKWAGLTKSPTS